MKPCKCGFGQAIDGASNCIICIYPTNPQKCESCKQWRAVKGWKICGVCMVRKKPIPGSCGFCGVDISKHDNEQKDKHLKKLSAQLAEELK